MDRCIFPNRKKHKMPTMLEFIRIKYCEGNYTSCARYMLYRKVEPNKIPDDLFPNDLYKAYKIIEQECGDKTTVEDPGTCNEKP